MRGVPWRSGARLPSVVQRVPPSMDLNSIPLFSLLAKRMAWLNERQAVLAQNVANADTPGYKPLDLKPLDFHGLAREAAGRATLATTRPGHLAPRGAKTGIGAPVQQEVLESSPSGNAVVLEEEMMKVGQTRLDYDLAVSLYRKHISLIRVALSGRGR